MTTNISSAMQHSLGRERQENSQSGGHALASLEAQPDWKHVSDHGHSAANRGQGVELCRPGGRDSREREHQKNRQPALESIKEQRRNGQALAAGAGHVGGADVAAADGAHVDSLKDAHQDVAEGNGAEKIGADDDGNQSWNHSCSYSLSDAAAACQAGELQSVELAVARPAGRQLAFV